MVTNTPVVVNDFPILSLIIVAAAFLYTITHVGILIAVMSTVARNSNRSGRSAFATIVVVNIVLLVIAYFVRNF